MLRMLSTRSSIGVLLPNVTRFILPLSLCTNVNIRARHSNVDMLCKFKLFTTPWIRLMSMLLYRVLMYNYNRYFFSTLDFYYALSFRNSTLLDIFPMNTSNYVVPFILHGDGAFTDCETRFLTRSIRFTALPYRTVPYASPLSLWADVNGF